MGLFDKKFCDICGEKIGLLGNRKLEDGNLCKNCARKLSPFFSERRNSTVAEIKEQLVYREENEKNLTYFNPALIFGNNDKVYVDVQKKKFVVCSSSNWRSANPDIIDFSQVISVSTDIVENKEEIYKEDENGNQVSYNPPRYEVDYEFNIVLQVDSPWFSQIEIELSNGDRPDSRYTDGYREYERQINELSRILSGNSQTESVNTQTAVQTNDSWICAYCDATNQGKFCSNCGQTKPISPGQIVRCDKCGFKLPSGQQVPKFCPECGDPITFTDMQ